MEEVEKGNFENTDVAVGPGSEIDSLGNSFNLMTARIRQLMEQNTYEQEEKRKSELKALRSQINPHFLYNTLDSINWMAMEKEEYEISRMVRNLGVILRYSVDKSNKMATIAEMADWLENM